MYVYIIHINQFHCKNMYVCVSVVCAIGRPLAIDGVLWILHKNARWSPSRRVSRIYILYIILLFVCSKHPINLFLYTPNSIHTRIYTYKHIAKPTHTHTKYLCYEKAFEITQLNHINTATTTNTVFPYSL